MFFCVVELNFKSSQRGSCTKELKTLCNSFLVLAKLLVKEKCCPDLPMFLNNLEAVINRIE